MIEFQYSAWPCSYFEIDAGGIHERGYHTPGEDMDLIMDGIEIREIGWYVERDVHVRVGPKAVRPATATILTPQESQEVPDFDPPTRLRREADGSD